MTLKDLYNSLRIQGVLHEDFMSLKVQVAESVPWAPLQEISVATLDKATKAIVLYFEPKQENA